MTSHKKRGRPQVVVRNDALKAALNAGLIPDSAIRSACLSATDSVFLAGSGDSPETIEYLLRTLEVISTASILKARYAGQGDGSKRHAQRLAKECRKAAGLLEIHVVAPTREA